jgi:uncharacterized protein
VSEIRRAKLASLRTFLRDQGSLVVAYSGGVDSAFLLAVSSQTLGDRSLGVIADSPSLPRRALEEALALAEGIDAKVEVIATAELENAEYTSNPPDRCYFCKAELFAKLEALAHQRGFAALAYGENADDARQVRPGRRAATEFRVLTPLRDVGLTKTEIRDLSREMKLPTADAPAQPCLSSRIPHGTPVTVEALSMIERGEALIRGAGFRVFRLRHHVGLAGERARVEIAPDEMPRLPANETEISRGLQQIGYAQVEFDPRGYRAGF